MLSMALFEFGQAKYGIPKSVNDRDNQAISGIKAAIQKPQYGITLVECEFPPLQALNKLGDGSLRSTLEAEDVSSLTTSSMHSYLS